MQACHCIPESTLTNQRTSEGQKFSKFKARSHAQLEGKGRGRIVEREVERKRGEDRKDGKGRGEERKRKAA